MKTRLIKDNIKLISSKLLYIYPPENIFLRETMVMFTPSVHAALAHSPDLIEQNENRGLQNYNESGLEANHKYLRIFRQNYSRKMSQYQNLEDCFKKLWVKSDPVLFDKTHYLYCKCCESREHTVKSCPKLHEQFTCATEFESLLNMVTN